MQKLYQLNQPLTFGRPQTWSVHARYALLIQGEEVTVPAGSWLLELGSEITWDGSLEYLYRLATGAPVALERPLSTAEGEANLVTCEQAMTAMSAFRTLEQAAYEDFGVDVESIDPWHPPFRLIKCPFCGGVEFTSVDLALVVCVFCNSQFSTRHTGGDPGWVLDAFWPQSFYTESKLLLPHSNFLSLRMVFKNSSNPLDMSCTDGQCEPGNPALTTEDDPSLRPGLHVCHIGDVSPWKLTGWAPDYIEYNRQGRGFRGWQIDDQWWPRCAFIRTASLLDEEVHTLQRIHEQLSRLIRDEELARNDLDLAALGRLLEKAPRRPMVYPAAGGSFIPDLTKLRGEQRYLLHHWVLTKDSDSLTEMAWPVWYVVKPIWGRKSRSTGGVRPLEGWKVVKRNICPCCTTAVSYKELVKPERHRHCCQTVWAPGGWQPHLDALEKEEAGVSAVEVTE